jgi:hypothetical protein
MSVDPTQSVRLATVRSQNDQARIPARDAGFQDQVGPVLQQLRTSISAIIEAIPGGDPIARPIDLQRALGLRSTLAWQIHKLGSSTNPVTEGPPIPGSEALQRFFRAAASRGVSKRLIETAARAVDQLQAFVKAHAGDRSAFDSMVSGLKQTGSTTVDLQHKRAAFKAQSHIWGVQARISLACALIQPSEEDPLLGDGMTIGGLIDLKRFRPGTRVILTRAYAADTDGQVRHSPTRLPIDPAGLTAQGIPLMTDFSSKPAPRIHVISGVPGEVTLEIEGDAIGNESRLTCLTGNLFRNALSRYRDEHNTSEAVVAGVRVPSEVLIHDILVHEDMYGVALSPGVSVYSNIGGESKSQHKEVDRLPLRETVSYLGRGPSALATPEVPRYTEMIEYALRRFGWDGRRFLAYRCRVDYPVMPSSVELQFDLPERPGKQT